MAPKLVSLRSAYKSKRVGSSYVQILGTGMDIGEAAPSVLLFFDNMRILFNAGEGIQRLFIEHKIKLSKIDHVVFTRASPQTTDGLFGMLLTLAGETRLTANIWGPSGLEHFLGAIRTFLPFSSMLHSHIFEPATMPDGGLVIKEDVVQITGIPLQPREELFPESLGRTAMVYVCQLPEVAGKFDPAKAAALGVKPGRKYGELQNGMTVESDDGKRTIYPSDVMEPSKPGPSFILVDCPTVSHVSALISAKALHKFWSENTAEVSSLAFIMHISPISVVQEASYIEWMTKFGTVQHILAGSGCSKRSVIFRTSALQLAKLNLLCPSVFPVVSEQEEGFNDVAEKMNAMSIVRGYHLLKFQLHPLSAMGLDKTSKPEEFRIATIQKELLSETPGISLASAELDNVWASRSFEHVPSCITGNREDMELVFLGTGSSHPSKHRNVSGIYIHLFERGGILLDCGEDTYGQLKRRYGNERANSLLANLKFIWISHIHADHQSGLARVLTARKALLQKQGKLEPLLLIGPRLLRRFLIPYEKLEDLAIRFLDCSQTTMEADDDLDSPVSKRTCTEGVSASGSESSEQKKLVRLYSSGEIGCHLSTGIDEAGRRKLNQVLAETGLKSILSVPVIHCPYAYGVVLESRGQGSLPGWKLAYSGDTRPCEAFVEASKGSTMFIHEATFDDGLLDDALEKFHSLTCEAVQAGAAAGAYRTILTHFSQRYPMIPVFDESYNESTCVAFDMMTVNLVDLPLLPKLVPELKLVFRDEIETSDE